MSLVLLFKFINNNIRALPRMVYTFCVLCYYSGITYRCIGRMPYEIRSACAYIDLLIDKPILKSRMII
jgi:hypothetical protein